MKEEIEIAKKAFTECARKKNCGIPKSEAKPAPTETIEIPKIKLSEFIKITGRRFRAKNNKYRRYYIDLKRRKLLNLLNRRRTRSL